MKSLRILCLGALSTAALMCATPTFAGVVNETLDFSLGGFIDIEAGQPSPTSNISGSITATFDPTQNYTDDTADLVVHSFSGTSVGSSLGFTYDPSNHFFWFGGTQNGSSLDVAGTDDFVITYDLTNLSDPMFVSCGAPGIECGSQTGNSAYDATAFTRTASPELIWIIAAADSVSGVPEPSTWAMLLLGFAGIGFAGYRRTRARSVSFAAS